jgi:hypothetical protein
MMPFSRVSPLSGSLEGDQNVFHNQSRACELDMMVGHYLGRGTYLSHNKARAVTSAEYCLPMSQPTFAIECTGTSRISKTSLQCFSRSLYARHKYLANDIVSCMSHCYYLTSFLLNSASEPPVLSHQPSISQHATPRPAI